MISNKLNKTKTTSNLGDIRANHQEKLDKIQKNKFWTKNQENKG